MGSERELKGERQIKIKKKKNARRDFPGGPVVKIPRPNVGGMSSTPGQGARMQQARLHSQ